MKESDVRLKVQHALMWRDWRPLHFQDGRVFVCQNQRCRRPNVVKPTHPGRPDLIIIHHQFPSVFMEVKDCKEQSFAFDEISQDQRDYLNNWKGDSYVGIGRIIPAGTKETIHSIYVIPWKLWLRMEEDIKTLLDDKSVPYSYELFENNVAHRTTDLVNRFSDYQLECRDGDWHFKENHPLAVIPEVEAPFHKTVRKEKLSEPNPT